MIKQTTGPSGLKKNSWHLIQGLRPWLGKVLAPWAGGNHSGRTGLLVKSLLLLPCGLLLGRLALGDDLFPDPIPEVKTYEWKISPAGESSPALKYRLYPALVDTVRGNAATRYLRAQLMIPRVSSEQIDRENGWYDCRTSDLPLDDVKKWLAARQIVIDEIVAATRCDSCDWGTRFEDLRGLEVIYIRLPEFQEMRQLARVLKLKAQVEIAEHRVDDAVNTLRMLYRMATDVAKSHSIIVNLISTSIASVANEMTAEVIMMDHSPNLYWGLRTLPDPLLDRLAVAQVDVGLGLQLFPFLTDADTAQRTPEQWQRLLADAIHELRSMTHNSPSGEAGDAVNQISATVLIMRSYPLAKRELIDQGMNAETVERMPVGQVVSIYVRNCYQHVAQEFEKWASLPYAEGESHLRRLMPRLQETGYLRSSPMSIASRDPLLINQALLPSFMAGEAFNRPRRIIALLATVEAIRMHAAANRNALPAQLSDITAVPVPLDPATAKSFLYRVVDGQAELLAPPTLPGVEYSGRRFLLRIQ
jgi:hypothetical protein